MGECIVRRRSPKKGGEGRGVSGGANELGGVDLSFAAAAAAATSASLSLSLSLSLFLSLSPAAASGQKLNEPIGRNRP